MRNYYELKPAAKKEADLAQKKPSLSLLYH